MMTTVSGEHHQSFADSFVNQATHRQVRAENGIGNRGVSTALVASLTVPVDDLAGSSAPGCCARPSTRYRRPNRQVESTRAGMEEFLIKAGVHPVLRRHGSDFAEPEPANGAREVTAALNDRRESMRAGIDSLKAQLGRDVPQLVQGFDPDGAVARAARQDGHLPASSGSSFGHSGAQSRGGAGRGQRDAAPPAGRARGTDRARRHAAADSGAARQDVPQGAVDRRGAGRGTRPAGRVVRLADARGLGRVLGPAHGAVAAAARPGPAGPGRADQGADRVRPPGRGGLQPPGGRAVPQARWRVLPAASRDGPDGAVLPPGRPAAARALCQRRPPQCQLHRVRAGRDAGRRRAAGARRTT